MKKIGLHGISYNGSWEQIEEENLASLLLDKIKIVGGEKANGDALYLLDKDLEKGQVR
jgi:ferritin